MTEKNKPFILPEDDLEKKPNTFLRGIINKFKKSHVSTEVEILNDQGDIVKGSIKYTKNF